MHQRGGSMAELAHSQYMQSQQAQPLHQQQQLPQQHDPAQVHCYTNPSFCRQSEYIPDHDEHAADPDLPPPPQFQMDDLPPPPAVHQTPPPQYGQSNPAFRGSPEKDLSNKDPRQQHQRSTSNLNRTATDRYCYIDDDPEAASPQPVPTSALRRYGSLPLGRPEHRAYAYKAHRYEYIHDDLHLQQIQQQQLHHQLAVSGPRYEYVEEQRVQQRSAPTPAQMQQPHELMEAREAQATPPARSAGGPCDSYRSADAHYTTLGPEAPETLREAAHWSDEGNPWGSPRHQIINTPRGRYVSVPLHDEPRGPPSLPERNVIEPGVSQLHQQPQRSNSSNAVATQKLHEILTTPRKPRKRSQGDALSPMNSPQRGLQPMLHHSLMSSQRSIYTPGCSPSSTSGYRSMNSPARQHPQQQGTPPSRALSPRRGSVGAGVGDISKGPATSTPTKGPPSARRCLPLNEPAGPTMLRRHLDDSQTYGRAQLPDSHYQQHVFDSSVAEEAMYIEHKKQQLAAANQLYHQGVEAAFIARTAVVPPLSPPASEANTTLISGTEKYERRNAPILLILVGILTCGLAIYLSSTQGRRYYLDSAVGCGALCALAGASRSLRRTWTGLGLAGLAALSCAGLLLLAVKAPRPGSPLHDLVAGALCGVSLLGAALAFLALLSPRCSLGRHHRVHSWIPGFSP
ncbi:hypothetical protein QAD02_020274 [Eretmocerus hayati]|uniref:Uncharacterized protein n=1 Tax=Eretmocerus hayati TaxID=131215 RepID=A0ACC2PM15_9HYME|nr:hypothetical protein QAD02_020274 [Eretmocerus hayati]